MASLLWRRSVTTSVRSNRYLLTGKPAVVRGQRKMLTSEDGEMVSLTAVKVTALSSLAVQKAMLGSIRQRKMTPFGQSVSVDFRRPFSTDFRRMYCSKNEQEVEEKRDREKVVAAMYDQLREMYNTSQKILLVCLADFDFAQKIAIALGDARKIVVTSQYSCGELKRMYEDVESQMCDLTKLGATIVFNVDVEGFSDDSRINHTLYNRIVLVPAY